MERERTQTSRQAPRMESPAQGKGGTEDPRAATKKEEGSQKGKKAEGLYDLNVGDDGPLPVDDPLVAGWGPMGEKTCSQKTNRQAGDICGYEFCGGKNEHLNADEKASVAALMAYLATKKNIDPAKCKDEDVITVLMELRELNLKNTKIKDITPLFQLYKLETLDLSENQIDRLTYLSGMKKLKSLRVNKNSLTSFNGLQRLYDLEEIIAADNQISSVAELAKLEKLKTLDIRNNQVSSIVLLADRPITIKYAGNPDILAEAEDIKEDAEEVRPNCYKKSTDKGTVAKGDAFDTAEGGVGRTGEYTTCFLKDGEMTVQKVSDEASQ